MKQPRSAHGGDRLKVGPDGTFALSCRATKDWIPRRPEQGLRKPFPGTCVRWDGDLFEVVALEEIPNGVRYRLAPWDDSLVVRVLEDYDEASEQERAASRRAASARQKKRTLSLWLSVVAGLLPASVQDEMESELGIRASRMTMASTILPFAIGGASFIFLLAAMFGAGTASLKHLAGAYFFLESFIRFAFALATGRPIGSILLVAPWAILHVRRRGNVAPLPPIAPDPSVLELDAYRIREPFLALLPAEDQWRLASRYGFDLVGWGRKTAAVILLFALLGIATGIFSEERASIAALLVAAYVAAEQVVRLITLARGLPAGSIFGILVRPFARRVL